MSKHELNPENIPPKEGTPPLSPDEVMESFDTYQKKVEKDWESAKNSYQKKINQLMDDFLKQGIPDIQFEEPKKESGLIPPAPENLTSDLDQTLKKARSKFINPTHFSPRSIFTPEPLYSRWDFLRKWKTISVGIATVLCLFFFISIFKTQYPVKLPYTHATGLVIEGDKIYIVDWFRKALFTHEFKKGLPIVNIDSIQTALASGLAKSDQFFWTLDALNKKIQEFSVSQERTVNNSYDIFAQKPSGLYFDGKDLWSGDALSKTIYRHHGNAPDDILEEYTFEGMNVTALEVKNNRVWILDGKSRELGLFRLQKPLKKISLYDLDPHLQDGSPTSFYWKGNNLYLLTTSPAWVYRISKWQLERHILEKS
ncbi:MAG: hypothetical protein ACKVQC_06895 [Elusimicrobiota bacterium]